MATKDTINEPRTMTEGVSLEGTLKMLCAWYHDGRDKESRATLSRCIQGVEYYMDGAIERMAADDLCAIWDAVGSFPQRTKELDRVFHEFKAETQRRYKKKGTAPWSVLVGKASPESVLKAICCIHLDSDGVERRAVLYEVLESVEQLVDGKLRELEDQDVYHIWAILKDFPDKSSLLAEYFTQLDAEKTRRKIDLNERE